MTDLTPARLEELLAAATPDWSFNAETAVLSCASSGLEWVAMLPNAQFDTLEKVAEADGQLFALSTALAARVIELEAEAERLKEALEETVARTIERCAQVADQHAARAAARCRSVGEGGDCAIEDRAYKEAGLIASSIRARAALETPNAE